MERLYCCDKCFEDEIIKKYILLEELCGDCDYCGEEDANIVPIKELYETYFQKLFSYYQETQHGEHYIHQLHSDPSDFGDNLYNLIQEDWGIFPCDYGESLLYEIMSYGRDYETEGFIDESVLFSRASDAMSYIDETYLWNSLSSSLVKENRFFPKKYLDFNYSTDSLLNEIENSIKNFVVNIIEPTEFFRSRIGYYTDPQELKAPPYEKILKGGRANPVGISVLYCAFSVETAISEVRPWKGAKVTVATIRNKGKLKLIDLSKINPIISPFQFEDIMSEIRSRSLLLILQQMLSRPIDPNKSEIEYIPSQFLTEYIKSLEYDGVIFKSSLGKDNNIVIFNELKTVIKQLEYFEVSNIEFFFDKRVE